MYLNSILRCVAVRPTFYLHLFSLLSLLFAIDHLRERNHDQHIAPGLRQFRGGSAYEIAGRYLEADRLDGYPSREFCDQRYGSRHFLLDETHHIPPYLYSFPGSGNTWCRLLIDYSTGVYSGSVFLDLRLEQILPGEKEDSFQRLSVVKAHPGLKYSVSQLIENWIYIDRAIFLIRNPFDAIWAEFEREMAKGDHTKSIPVADFDWKDWEKRALHLSDAYLRMWKVDYLEMSQAFGSDNIIHMRFEELTHPDKRIEALRKIVHFIGIPSNRGISDEQLQCAFVLGDDPRAHRQGESNAAPIMTKELAYGKEGLVCKMWAIFGEHATKAGYGIWKDTKCES